MINEEQDEILLPIFERISQKTGIAAAEIREIVLGEP